ncbi:MAG: ATP phosphoribosyltransferase regulatory subunit [Alphaproteobacteria bacterium]|nr:MAG: ATP phosphoribosyltransferase regulatory subunit [Alphaproteobacteria bacterium]
MSAEAARLRDQRALVSASFEAAGFELCETDVLQPADPFLELSGEDIRRRTYVFTDAYGRELCLRPDLTIPTALHYLQSLADGAVEERRFYYNGLAFRCQRPGLQRPNEFLQHGLEIFGGEDVVALDVEVFRETWAACQAAGVAQVDVRLGDLSLFSDFISEIDIAPRWKERLSRSFWRPKEFSRLLHHLADEETETTGLLRMLSQLPRAEAEDALADLLDLKGSEPQGGRSVSEITERLQAKALDAMAPPIPQDVVELIDQYLAIAGPAEDVVERIRGLFETARLKVPASVDALAARIKAIKALGIDVRRIRFATEFGRNLEYYTGFVFELTAPELGTDSQIAGGGRYDRLLRALGASIDIPAVGAMIRADRLAAVTDGKGRAQ